MQKTDNLCLGCKTYFYDNEKLPLQSMRIQFKNYKLPLKDSKSKWTILKTIVAFLNSKGGIIYIGVNDSDGEIVGNFLQRKQCDEFMLLIRQLVERISPAIDLVNREVVLVQYVPIIRNKVFQGSYIVKIIVKQGDPHFTYCFCQKIQLINDVGKVEEIQIPHGFYRHSMGGIGQLKGIKLIEQAQKKAMKPSLVEDAFHFGCNPDPPQLPMKVLKIGFSGVTRKSLRNKLKNIFKTQLQKLQIERYELTEDIENHVLLIELDTLDQFQEVKTFITTNLSHLNEKEEKVQFQDKGVNMDFYLFRNSKYQLKPNKDPKQLEDTAEQPRQDKKQKPPKNCWLTLTHINPNLKQELCEHIKSSSKYFQANVQLKYQNSIVISVKGVENAKSILETQMEELNKFGFKDKIIVGVNTGSLHLINYDTKKRNNLKIFIQKEMQQDLSEAQFKKEGNHYYLDISLKKKQDAYKWLDRLLKNKELKQFRYPGSENGKAAKMKIMLQCKEP